MNKEPWIQTFTGKKFYPLNPRSEDIDIIDIAHGLSMQCRFGGHCRVFYSVAQHSVLVSKLLPKDLALRGLMHDAAEAYVSDIVRPIKIHLPLFKEMEDKVHRAIAEKFNYDPEITQEILDADNKVLVTERRDLMCQTSEDWCLDHEPCSEIIIPVSSVHAEILFRDYYSRIMSQGIKS